MATVELRFETLDAVLDAFTAECRRGEAPTVAEYASRHPHCGRDIERLLPVVQLMERRRRELLETPPRGADLPRWLGDYEIVR